MSEAVLLLSKGLFAAAGCFAGVILGRSALSEGAKLHGIVCALIFLGGIGLLGFGLGPALASHSETLARGVMIVGDGFERIALLLLAWFVWHVFGRGDGFRRVVLAIVVSLLCLDWIQILLVQQWPDGRLPVLADAGSQLAFSTPLIWSSLETWLEYQRSRRQLAIGLTHPFVTNRFCLWSLATGCLALVCVTTALTAVLAGEPQWVSGLQLLIALLYTGVAGILMLGLSPPPIYRRWLESGA